MIKAVSFDGVEHGAARRVAAHHVEVVPEHDGGGLAARALHGRQRPPLARRRRVAQQVARVPPRVRAAAHHVDQTWGRNETIRVYKLTIVQSTFYFIFYTQIWPLFY